MKEVMYKMTILSETKPEKPGNQRVETLFLFFVCSMSLGETCEAGIFVNCFCGKEQGGN